jgi:hypothetical protein
MRRVTCAYLLAVSCIVAACSSSTTDAPRGGGSPDTSTRAPSGDRLLVTEAQNHATLTAHVGEVVHVRLGSTYWRFDPLAGAALRTAGSPSFAPHPSCIPGGGCGTVTQAYRAERAGTVRITASRTTCGEALRCRPDQRSFRVTLVVTK